MSPRTCEMWPTCSAPILVVRATPAIWPVMLPIKLHMRSALWIWALRVGREPNMSECAAAKTVQCPTPTIPKQMASPASRIHSLP